MLMTMLIKLQSSNAGPVLVKFRAPAEVTMAPHTSSRRRITEMKAKDAEYRHPRHATPRFDATVPHSTGKQHDPVHAGKIQAHTEKKRNTQVVVYLDCRVGKGVLGMDSSRTLACLSGGAIGLDALGWRLASAAAGHRLEHQLEQRRGNYPEQRLGLSEGQDEARCGRSIGVICALVIVDHFPRFKSRQTATNNKVISESDSERGQGDRPGAGESSSMFRWFYENSYFGKLDCHFAIHRDVKACVLREFKIVPSVVSSIRMLAIIASAFYWILPDGHTSLANVIANRVLPLRANNVELGGDLIITGVWRDTDRGRAPTGDVVDFKLRRIFDACAVWLEKF
ncbi:hypothetical protein BJ138DRAFT_1191535 [Hygrophoropsis aurantiaca]|uniref:Uncharacterized protein n=1 Tax=Hygrophoropsis aurantiaca TaxID=72124 RepID=A0ACB7ZRY2_9AGAM|nr:hypothetical protein BJ138DRAFT_1191535 [Hygrophoropsis aurantiaca]